MPSRSVLSFALLAGLPLAATAQVRLERKDMPFVPAPSRPRLSVPVINLIDGGPTDNLHAQVNVGPGGLNIVGDAANEPSLAVDPTAPNRLAIGWRQFDTISSNFRQAGRAFSRDGGRTWTNPGPLQPGIFRSDPVLRATSAGAIYYLSLTNTGPGAGYSCQLFTSGDGGATFGPAVEATGGDKSWFVVDDTASAGAGFLHQAWSIGGIADRAYTRSTTAGATWGSAVTTIPVWGTLAVNNSGDLFIGGIVSAGSSSNTSFRCARSTNAQNSAVTPSFATATVPFTGHIGFNIAGSPNPGGLLGQVSIGVDRSGGPRNGWIYMLCSVVPATGTDPCEVYFNRSTDGGATWLATPIRVNNDAAGPGRWQWFGTMSVAPNGRIDAVWNDTRESLVANLSRLYYAWSDDGGTTWQGNTPVGPALYDSTIGWPQQNKMGDYYDMTSDRVGAFLTYAATYNGEQDVYFLRLNDYDCNNNGIPDATDLANGTLHDCNANGIPDECEAAAGVQVVCPCYPNCDGSTTAPALNVLDFACFLNRYAAGDTYANCDNSTTPPTLNVLDFACFLNAYAAGCP